MYIYAPPICCIISAGGGCGARGSSQSGGTVVMCGESMVFAITLVVFKNKVKLI